MTPPNDKLNELVALAKGWTITHLPSPIVGRCWDKGDGNVTLVLPSFTSDISAAMGLMEELPSYSVQKDSEFGYIVRACADKQWVHQAEGQHLPTAITTAYLRAKGVDEQKINEALRGTP